MSAPVIITSVEAYVKALLHCYKYPTQPIMGFLIGKYLNTHHATQTSITSILEEDTKEHSSDAAKVEVEVEVDDKSNTNSKDNSVDKENNNSNNSTMTSTTPEQVHSQILPQNQIRSESFGPHSCYVTDVVPLFHTLPMTYPHPMVDVALAHTMSIAKTNGLSLLGVYIANERCDDRTLSPLLRPLLEALQTRLTKNHKLLLWMVDNQTLQSPPLSLSISTLFYPGSEIIEKGIALPPPTATNVMTLQSGQVKSSATTGTNDIASTSIIVGEDNTAASASASASNNDKIEGQLNEDMNNLDVNDKSLKKKTNAQGRNARRNKNNGGKKSKVINTNKGNKDDDKDDYDYDDEDMGEDSIMLDLWFGQWNSATLMPERNMLLESAIEAMGNALSTFAHYKIVDFEEHLENPRLNYLEQPLEQLMRKEAVK